MMLKKVFAFYIIFACSFPLYSQNTIYVSTSGNDNSGNGTINNPFETLQAALDISSDNDTIILRGGQYESEEIRIEHNNITIMSYPGEWATISAPTDNTNITSCIWYHDPEIIGGTLDSLEITGGYLYGVKMESNWDWGYPIPDRHGTSNIIIKHCRIHDTGRDCIKIPSGCNSITIENCEIYNSGIGISNDPNNPNAEGIDLVNNDSITIKNNYIHDISTNGIYSKGGSIATIIENNLVINTGEGGILLGFYTDQEWFDTIANPNYYENLESIVRNNIIINTNMEGIGLYAAYKPRVYNNTIVNAALENHAALFINHGYIWIDEISDMIEPPCVDVFVVNNIFTTTSNMPNLQIRYYDDDTTTNMQGNCTINYNIYYKQTGAEFDDGINWQLLSLQEWNTATGFDNNSNDTNPMLDTTYHLTQTSIAINNGNYIQELIYDYDGNNRDNAIDIGADEYGAGPNLNIPPDTNVIGTGGGTIYLTQQPENNTFDSNNITVFPNPVTNTLIIKNNTTTTVNLELFNITGNKITLFTVKKQSVGKLNTSFLPDGIYFLINTKNNKKITTVIKTGK